jgi:hypothetical protein
VNRFNPGHVVATPGALAVLEASGKSLLGYLARHLSGDWGDVDADDARENELSLKNDWRFLSAYTLKSGTKIWVITEADRSSTCICCPRSIEIVISSYRYGPIPTFRKSRFSGPIRFANDKAGITVMVGRSSTELRRLLRVVRRGSSALEMKSRKQS